MVVHSATKFPGGRNTTRSAGRSSRRTRRSGKRWPTTGD
jgi:hypothetical protein